MIDLYKIRNYRFRMVKELRQGQASLQKVNDLT